MTTATYISIKLDEKDTKEVLRRYKLLFHSPARLAKDFGVSVRTIQRIVTSGR